MGIVEADKACEGVFIPNVMSGLSSSFVPTVSSTLDDISTIGAVTLGAAKVKPPAPMPPPNVEDKEGGGREV